MLIYLFNSLISDMLGQIYIFLIYFNVVLVYEVKIIDLCCDLRDTAGNKSDSEEISHIWSWFAGSIPIFQDAFECTVRPRPNELAVVLKP